ncbi:CoA transferase [Nocardia sp. NPDC005825]|uniref:CaiB/BaiF CoA-transferase family protein n=1 Tax=unclassified Nocardia TaxID=2637762 RepID=UPI003404F149
MPFTTPVYDPPLAGVRIVDLTGGPMTAIGRLLADLGAEITHVMLRNVSDDAVTGPVVDAIPLGTVIDRLGIEGVAIDTTTNKGARRWQVLLSDADILIEMTRPGSAAEDALNIEQLREQHPGLVVLSISDFGRDNDYSRWQATTPVYHALTSELSRSGLPGREPLLPPGELPYHVAAAQAVTMTISVFLDRLRTGRGDRIDFSILHGAMQALDPPFGMVGSASAGQELSALPRGRADERHRYPIIACRDGHVRICLLATRQWRGMFEWLGQPDQFADPAYDHLVTRFRSPTLLAAIADHFSGRTRAELEIQGQAYGVPIAPLLDLEEALSTEQLEAREFLREVEIVPGLVAPVPAGIAEIDGHRASVLTPAYSAGSRVRQAPILARRERLGLGLPLEGIRVLDLGVIVVGGDTGRLLGDLGADVIKIENSMFPDGSRAALHTPMAQGFAAGHRNKRGIGLNLRDPEGQRLVHRLVACSDIVLTNFKPGVIETLGLDYATLEAINPDIVVVDNSAFGPTGPWAQRLGYGPLVRAAAGVTDQWVYPGEAGSFSDAMTVYPDHVCARIGVAAALAMLIRRERTGTGGSVSIAQSEVMLSHLASTIAARALARSGRQSVADPNRDLPWGLYPAAGDDEWLAITARDGDDWAALCTVIGRPELAEDPELSTRAGRAAHGDRIDDAVREWSSKQQPHTAMIDLQHAGVPAGAMLRAADLQDFEYYRQRRAFRTELHPHDDRPYVLENVQIHADAVADPPVRQAPLLGEQTYEIAAELLGLDAEQVDTLITRGVLESATMRRVRPDGH